MQDDIMDAIGRTLQRLVRPRVAPPDDSVLRAAVLYDDAGDLAQEVQDGGLEVVYTLATADVPSTVGADLVELVPPFDWLCTNVPAGAEQEALSLTLRFLRLMRPHIFMLDGQGDYGDDFLQTVQDRTRQLGYNVEWSSRFIVGALT